MVRDQCQGTGRSTVNSVVMLLLNMDVLDLLYKVKDNQVLEAICRSSLEYNILYTI